MMKWLQWIQLGMRVLVAVEALALGQTAEFSFEWKGKVFTITIANAEVTARVLAEKE